MTSFTRGRCAHQARLEVLFYAALRHTQMLSISNQAHQSLSLHGGGSLPGLHTPTCLHWNEEWNLFATWSQDYVLFIRGTSWRVCLFLNCHTHTHTHPLFHDDVCFSHYSLLRKETDRMSPACLSIRWIFESVRVCLRARCFKVMGLRTTWSRCGWAILSLYRSWFPASVFPLRYRPLKKQLPAVEHAHKCSPVKKKKKRVDIKGRHELAHIWDQIPVIQPVWGGGGGVNNEQPLHAVIAHRHTWVRRVDMSAIFLPPCLSFSSLIETDLSLKHR